jgi:hypothetical protein
MDEPLDPKLAYRPGSGHFGSMLGCAAEVIGRDDLPPEQEDRLISIADLELYGLPKWAIEQLSLHGVLWVKDVGRLDRLPQTKLIQTLWKVLEGPMTNCYYNRPTTTIEKLLRPETWQQLDQITKN